MCGVLAGGGAGAKAGQYIPWHTALHKEGGALASAWDRGIRKGMKAGGCGKCGQVWAQAGQHVPGMEERQQ